MKFTASIRVFLPKRVFHGVRPACPLCCLVRTLLRPPAETLTVQTEGLHQGGGVTNNLCKYFLSLKIHNEQSTRRLSEGDSKVCLKDHKAITSDNSVS